MIKSLSVSILPLLFATVLFTAFFRKINIFQAFLAGAEKGIQALFGVLPALVGLVCAVTMLRASGALSYITALLAPLLRWIPAEIMPLALLRPFSGSGSLAIVNDLFKAHGPDSFVGLLASVIMGSSETTFYALAVYFGAVKIKNTRHTVPAALAADIAALLFGTLLCYLFFKN